MSESSQIDLEGVELFDLRSEQADPHPKSKKGSDGKTVRRKPSEIDSIVLHQTAVRFGYPRGKTERIDLARRSLGVACHVMAFHDGFVTWPAELNWYLLHADKLNRRSLGIEVDGNYPGVIGGRVTNDQPVDELTDAVIHAARMGVKLLVEEGRKADCPIKYIYAHRQTDSWRRSDPGEGLWRKVVLEYAIPVLGLEVKRDEVFKKKRKNRDGKETNCDGKPIPVEWDPDGIGKY